jgi:transposase, IS5 family
MASVGQAGIEARISHLKRGFRLRRTNLRHLPGAQVWARLRVFV